jgi:hypothetical protein
METCISTGCRLQSATWYIWSYWLPHLWDTNPVLFVMMTSVVLYVSWLVIRAVRKSQSGPTWTPHTVYEPPRFEESERSR